MQIALDVVLIQSKKTYGLITPWLLNKSARCRWIPTPTQWCLLGRATSTRFRDLIIKIISTTWQIRIELWFGPFIKLGSFILILLRYLCGLWHPPLRGGKLIKCLEIILRRIYGLLGPLGPLSTTFRGLFRRPDLRFRSRFPLISFTQAHSMVIFCFILPRPRSLNPQQRIRWNPLLL